jgi:hypothetical protein
MPFSSYHKANKRELQVFLEKPITTYGVIQVKQIPVKHRPGIPVTAIFFL